MSTAQDTYPSTTGTSSRVHVFDVVRGFSVISMVAFHLCYDLKFILGLPLSWFEPPLQDIWRASISWAFVLVAGCMFAWSRDNLKRSLRYLLAALAIYVVTTIAAVDEPINFGVIYCMGACTLTTYVLDCLGFRPRGYAPALAFFVVFILLLHISSRWIGIGPLRVSVPSALYSTPWLSWLGFPGPGFVSADYYPLLPFLLLYLCGSSLGRLWKDEGLPQPLQTISCEPLEAVGRHALPIYFIHQPVLLALCMLFVR